MSLAVPRFTCLFAIACLLDIGSWSQQVTPPPQTVSKSQPAGGDSANKKPVASRPTESTNPPPGVGGALVLGADTAPAPSVSKKVKLGKTSSQVPVDDYVPCMFDDDTGAGLRESTLPVRHLSDYESQILIKVSEGALTTSAQEALYKFGPTLPDGTHVEQQVQAIALAFRAVVDKAGLSGYTQAAALQIITDAAGIALSRVLGPFISSGKVDVKAVTLAASAALIDAADKSAVPRTPSNYTRPVDVSCSMAIMDWHETSDTFGRRVANQYVGVQVTIRNLNSTNEFLVHDVQVAVDSGVKNFNRFQVGRDKLLVRDVAQRGATEDRRNMVLAALEGVGAIAGSSAIAASRDFATAVAVYQGALIPAYSKLFPDHTIEQLNHINDLAFSSASSSKVIVPIQGSVPLVTFVLAKPIEQMPFAWCGYDSARRTFTGKRLRQYCASDYDNFSPGTRPSYADVYGFNETANTQNPGDGQTARVVLWDELPYKKWKAAAMQVLQQRTFVVISGVHIKELTKPATTSGLDCGKLLPDDSVDLSLAKDGKLTCKIQGASLEGVDSVKLELDPSKIAGTIRPSTDGVTDEVTFNVSDLEDGNGNYTLYFVDKSGKETSSGDEVKLRPQPVISTLPETLDLSKKPVTIKIAGKHLDKLATASLVNGADIIVANPLNPAADGTSLDLSFDDGSKLKADQSYDFHYTTKNDQSVDSAKLVKAINKPGAAAPAAPAHAAPKPKPKAKPAKP